MGCASKLSDFSFLYHKRLFSDTSVGDTGNNVSFLLFVPVH